jgi:hypothetical protein
MDRSSSPIFANESNAWRAASTVRYRRVWFNGVNRMKMAKTSEIGLLSLRVGSSSFASGFMTRVVWLG